jgi:transcriptional regulator with XRE-family HTH domain
MRRLYKAMEFKRYEIVSSPAPVKSGLGEWLSHTRRAQALSQRELAELLGVGDRTLRGWEAGQAPSWRGVRLIAEYFRVPARALLALDARPALPGAPVAEEP